MDSGKQRALVRQAVVACLMQRGEALASPSKVKPPPKVVPKRKGTGKDDHLAKKVTGQFVATNQVDLS